MKIKARVGTDFREEVVTELDQFVLETDKGEFRISWQNGRLRVQENTFYCLSIQPRVSNTVDIVAFHPSD